MRRLPDQISPVELTNILLVGQSGVGKTHSLGSLRGLWYFTHEADGVPVVRAANPTAHIYLLEDSLSDYGFLRPRSVVDDKGKTRTIEPGLLRREHGACGGNGCKECRFTGAQCAADGCRVVAYDGLSEAQRICLDHASTINGARRKSKLPDGAFDELDYNLAYYYLARLLGRFRDVRVPTIVLAHAQDPAPVVNLPAGGTAHYIRWHVPGRKFDSRIPRYFTAIGGMHHRLGTDERAVVFDPTVLWGERMFRCKPMAGVRPIEVPDPQLWLDNIAAAYTGLTPTGSPPEIEFERLASPVEPDPDPEPDGLTTASPESAPHLLEVPD